MASVKSNFPRWIYWQGGSKIVYSSHDLPDFEVWDSPKKVVEDVACEPESACTEQKKRGRPRKG